MSKKKNIDYTWNNRVVKKEFPGETLYVIHEAHYGEDKKTPHSITQDGVIVAAESVEALREVLESMIRCLDAPVLNYEDF